MGNGSKETPNQLIQQAVVAHYGYVIETVGDTFLVDFPPVVHAMQCAQQEQAELRTYNTDKEHTERIHVRIGIHSGDLVPPHFRSSARYWIASARCAPPTFSSPARSAMVRATLRMRVYARALNPSRAMALSKSFSPLASG